MGRNYYFFGREDTRAFSRTGGRGFASASREAGGAGRAQSILRRMAAAARAGGAGGTGRRRTTTAPRPGATRATGAPTGLGVLRARAASARASFRALSLPDARGGPLGRRAAALQRQASAVGRALRNPGSMAGLRRAEADARAIRRAAAQLRRDVSAQTRAYNARPTQPRRPRRRA